MLVLDEEFKYTFKTYYDVMHPFEIVKAITYFLEQIPPGIYSDLVNIVRAGDTIGFTYSNYHETACKKISFKLNSYIDLNLLVFNVAFFQFYSLYTKALESFLGVKFKIRDFYSEIATTLYGVANEETLKKIKQPEGHYSVDKPTPKNWDEWFYNMCIETAANSKCYSRKIGAVLVRDKSIISTGYNGPPRGVPTCDKRWFVDKKFASKYEDQYRNFLESGKKIDGVCPRRVIGFPSGQGLEICPAGHAERNALINAARHGIKTKGTSEEPTTLYMSCSIPCSPCLVEIINAGITEIVITGTGTYDSTAEYLLENSNLKIRLFDFLKI